MSNDALLDEILRTLKDDGPASGRQVAERVGRRVPTVVDGLRLLEKQGRVSHSGTRWTFVTTALPDVKWRIEWTVASARRNVRGFNHGIPHRDPFTPGGWWHPAGKFRTGPPPTNGPDFTIDAGVRVAHDEARRWCELHDAEWLAAHDAEGRELVAAHVAAGGPR